MHDEKAGSFQLTDFGRTSKCWFCKEGLRIRAQLGHTSTQFTFDQEHGLVFLSLTEKKKKHAILILDICLFFPFSNRKMQKFQGRSKIS